MMKNKWLKLWVASSRFEKLFSTTAFFPVLSILTVFFVIGILEASWWTIAMHYGFSIVLSAVIGSIITLKIIIYAIKTIILFVDFELYLLHNRYDSNNRNNSAISKQDYLEGFEKVRLNKKYKRKIEKLKNNPKAMNL